MRKRDGSVNVSQRESLMDARPAVQGREGVNPEAWQQANTINRAESYMIYKIYKWVITLISKESLYVRGEECFELQQ